MSIRNLDKLFKPRSVALIGATSRPGSVGAVVARNLHRAGFAGQLMFVNPHHHAIEELDVYPTVPSLPHPVDLAVIVTPPETVPRLIGELAEHGTRAAVIVTAGFDELGQHGCAVQQAALDAAKPHLLRIVGPNCVGIMVPGIGLDATFSHLAAPAGDIAFVSQSGAMITAMLDWAVPRGIGFSHVVSVGDMADVDFGDMLDYLAADPQTRAILLYAEGVTHGRKFMSAARAASRLKPVLVLKAGRSNAGARAATSHTGVLAGADSVYDAAFRRAGMLRVATMAELFDAAETLALTREQVGERLAILTNGGGAGVLATDALIAANGRLASLSEDTITELNRVLPATWSHGNPVDIIGDASGERYAEAMAALIRDPEVDAILVINCPTALAESEEAAAAVINVITDAEPGALRGRNVITAWLGEHSARAARQRFAEARVATYETPDNAVAGFMHRVCHRRNQELLMETPPARADAFQPDLDAVRHVITTALANGNSWLNPEEAGAILRAYSIPFVADYAAGSPDEAAAVATSIGFPVALKIRSPDIIHKTDVGGVALGLGDAERVRREASAMLERVRAVRPEARLDGFVLQPMISRPGAAELLIGLVDDPVFGPLVAFGQGGTAVEIVRDSSLEFPPLNPLLTRRLMARTRVWQLLLGYRGKPPADLDAIVEVLSRVSQLATDHPEIRELDINPLLADAAGAIALDARVRIASPRDPGTARLAIAPYPQDLASTEVLRDGTALRVRPLRAEDEPLLHDLAANMRAEDLRLRFFTPVRGLTHTVAARLSQLDYDREMALLAEREGTALGVAHFFADPDRLRAEYAIAVRSDWKGRGIGFLLMNRLIVIAGQWGIGELVGEVLRENQPMLQMCRELGFAIAPDPNNPPLVLVRKRLTTPRSNGV
ncbi:MAG: bifunctional acetate--CoA ligase family protein/GNAT family N-acetyltransferase [Alphaproteobacteria bacterium]|nr:bifunctional acetate--CoA ligase family protein/GNAT family N-acetyltransferase [Alphaproteobacteria bacterium]